MGSDTEAEAEAAASSDVAGAAPERMAMAEAVSSEATMMAGV
jgi:hypothetical protein